MRRREFIAGLGGAAAWPLGAWAQQPALPVIGFLSAGSGNLSPRLDALFLQGLKESGFVEGQNVNIEYRRADGQYDRLPAMAADLVNRRVAVIFASGGMLPAVAAKAATATIPIVFQGGGDPIRLGLVASLSRPGGNVTGAINLTGGATDAKAVQYLRELVPAAATLGVLVNRRNPQYAGSAVTQAHETARELRWEFQVFEANTDDDLKQPSRIWRSESSAR